MPALAMTRATLARTESSLCLKIDGPNQDENCRITISDRQVAIPMGRLGRSAGPHLLRIDKHGRAVTFSLYADYKAGAAPTLTKTVPDLTSAAPFLNKTNSSLFVAGDAVATAVGFSLDGKLAMLPAPGKVLKDIVGPEYLIKLAGVRSVPDYFVPTRDITFGKDGLGLAGKTALEIGEDSSTRISPSISSSTSITTNTPASPWGSARTIMTRTGRSTRSSAVPTARGTALH